MEIYQLQFQFVKIRDKNYKTLTMSRFQNNSYTFAQSSVYLFTKKCRKCSTICGIGEFHALVLPYYGIASKSCIPTAGPIFYYQRFVRLYSYTDKRNSTCTLLTILLAIRKRTVAFKKSREAAILLLRMIVFSLDTVRCFSIFKNQVNQDDCEK